MSLVNADSLVDIEAKPEAGQTVKKVVVGGLNEDITEEDIGKQFEKIVGVTHLTKKDTVKPSNVGFVEFDNHDPVDKVILQRSPQTNGKRVDVKQAVKGMADLVYGMDANNELVAESVSNEETFENIGDEINSGIVEVKMIKDSPKVQVSLAVNTFAVTGHCEKKQTTDLLPGILNQLKTETLTHLEKSANNVPTVTSTLAMVNPPMKLSKYGNYCTENKENCLPPSAARKLQRSLQKFGRFSVAQSFQSTNIAQDSVVQQISVDDDAPPPPPPPPAPVAVATPAQPQNPDAPLTDRGGFRRGFGDRRARRGPRRVRAGRGEWVPCTLFGRLVNDGKIKSLPELKSLAKLWSKPILELNEITKFFRGRGMIMKANAEADSLQMANNINANLDTNSQDSSSSPTLEAAAGSAAGLLHQNHQAGQDNPSNPDRNIKKCGNGSDNITTENETDNATNGPIKEKFISGGNDEKVLVHDLETGKTEDIFPHDEQVYGIAGHPECSEIFASASSDGRVMINDLRNSNVKSQPSADGEGGESGSDVPAKDEPLNQDGNPLSDGIKNEQKSSTRPTTPLINTPIKKK